MSSMVFDGNGFWFVGQEVRNLSHGKSLCTALCVSIVFYLQTWKDEWLPAELRRGGEQGESVLLSALTTPLPILTTTTKPLWSSPAPPRLLCQLPQQGTSQPHQSCGQPVPQPAATAAPWMAMAASRWRGGHDSKLGHVPPPGQAST